MLRLSDLISKLSDYLGGCSSEAATAAAAEYVVSLRNTGNVLCIGASFGLME